MKMEKPSTAKKLSVLIVDDEHGLRDMLSRVLSLKGYEVLAVEDGSVAVERVKERSFDVVICDIRMPGLDGIGTLRAVKSLRPEIAMVMASGYATLETAIEAMKLGAYDYLSKPFELDQLFAVLARAVEHGRLRKLLLEEVSHPTAGVFPTLRSALAPELEIIRAEAERLREAPLAETPAGRILHACDRVRMLLDEAVSPSAPPCE